MIEFILALLAFGVGFLLGRRCIYYEVGQQVHDVKIPEYLGSPWSLESEQRIGQTSQVAEKENE